VLDFIEPFRAPVVDRTMLGLVNKGVKIELDERGFLTDKTRRFLAEKVIGRLESGEKFEGKKRPLRAIIQLQARQLATYLRGERDEFTPFLAGW
jgi:CRISPR-associated protein Cas1